MSAFLCIIVLALPPAQVDRQPKQEETPLLEQVEDPGGFWPTEKMIRLMMHRWSDEVSERYRLDAGQKARWGEAMAARWVRFARDNRRQMQPVLSEFIEMRLEMKPPTTEQVKAWAARANPVFGKLKEELTAGSEDLRRLLKPGQRAKFDVDLLGFKMGLQVARAKLNLWAKGEFNERDFWDPPRSERQRRRAESEQANGGAPPEPEPSPDQIELELESWQKYVERFTRIYKLDEAQKATARSILKELRERALAHRDRHHVEIEKLERRIQTHDGLQEDIENIEEQLVVLYGPIDKMFDELKTRLDGIPTAAQQSSVDPPDDKTDK